MKKKISVNFFASPGIGKGRVNPFVPNVPFLYTHKISENLTWRIGKECIVNKWVNKNHLQYSSEVNISIFYLLISFRSCFTPLQKITEIPQVWGVCWGFPHSTKTNFIFKANNKEHLNKSLDAFWGFSCYLLPISGQCSHFILRETPENLWCWCRRRSVVFTKLLGKYLFKQVLPQ